MKEPLCIICLMGLYTSIGKRYTKKEIPSNNVLNAPFCRIYLSDLNVLIATAVACTGYQLRSIAGCCIDCNIISSACCATDG
jgi:hypothetical protein